MLMWNFLGIFTVVEDHHVESSSLSLTVTYLSLVQPRRIQADTSCNHFLTCDHITLQFLIPHQSKLHVPILANLVPGAWCARHVIRDRPDPWTKYFNNYKKDRRSNTRELTLNWPVHQIWNQTTVRHLHTGARNTSHTLVYQIKQSILCLGATGNIAQAMTLQGVHGCSVWRNENDKPKSIQSDPLAGHWHQHLQTCRIQENIIFSSSFKFSTDEHLHLASAYLLRQNKAK